MTLPNHFIKQIQDSIEALEADRPDTCFFPGCHEKSIKAHSLQRALLRQIALNDKVVALKVEKFKIKDIVSMKPPKLIQEMHVNQASTFYGFCQKHDGSLFDYIELNPIIANPKTALLLGYRAVCSFHHRLEHHRRCSQHLPRHTKEQARFLDWMDSEHMVSLSAATAIKRQYDEILVAERLDAVKFIAVELGSCPEVICSGQVYVDYDFQGNKIDLSSSRIGVVTLSILPTVPNKGIILYSWIGESVTNDIYKFVRSFYAVSRNSVVNCSLALAFNDVDHVYAAPSYWKGLNRKLRLLIQERLETQTSSYHKDAGLRVVDWPVNSIEDNVT